ncbi:MAG: Nudix family hydrolase [Pseudomonadota bacterium]
MVSPPLQVVCAVIEDPQGRLLLARRLAHQAQGGLWEFPGGKLEAGESQAEALSRELDEELGLQPLQATPWITVRHVYPEREVQLHAWRVHAWAGEPVGRLGQPLDWVTPAELVQREFPAANRPIVNALILPDACLITADAPDDERFLAALEQAAQRVRMAVLRGEQALRLAPQALPRLRAAGVLALVNATPEQARALGADGVHLNRHRLRELQTRPEGLRWVGASCHDSEELARAARLGLDYAFLSPVQPTASHPDATPLGWEGFAALIADHALPVYALGGMQAGDVPQARARGAQGVAAIRGLWPPGEGQGVLPDGA